MQLTTKVDLSRLLANIDKMPEVITQGLARGMELATELVEAEAVDRCPQKTTELSTSIQHEVIVSDAAVLGHVGSNSPHAAYVHEGTGLYAKDGNGRTDVPWVYCDEQGNFHATSGQKPNPFLQDAVDANKDKILQCFEGVLGK